MALSHACWMALGRSCGFSVSPLSPTLSRERTHIRAPLPQSRSSLGWLQPGSASQETLATQSTFCLGVEEDPGPSAQAQGRTRVGSGV